MLYTCTLSSPMVGTGSRHDPYRPLFRDEFPNCDIPQILSGGPGQGSYVLDVRVPDEPTRLAIVEDERFPSWDWAEIPQEPLGAQQTG